MVEYYYVVDDGGDVVGDDDIDECMLVLMGCRVSQGSRASSVCQRAGFRLRFCWFPRGLRRRLFVSGRGSGGGLDRSLEDLGRRAFGGGQNLGCGSVDLLDDFGVICCRRAGGRLRVCRVSRGPRAPFGCRRAGCGLRFGRVSRGSRASFVWRRAGPPLRVC